MHHSNLSKMSSDNCWKNVTKIETKTFLTETSRWLCDILEFLENYVEQSLCIIDSTDLKIHL